MKAIEFDIEFCKLPLWVEVKGTFGDWEIEKVGIYTDGICKEIDWESAFDYDFFFGRITERANLELGAENE